MAGPGESTLELLLLLLSWLLLTALAAAMARWYYKAPINLRVKTLFSIIIPTITKLMSTYDPGE